MTEIALLTQRKWVDPDPSTLDWYGKNILDEDALVIAACEARGFHCTRVGWDDPTVDWSRFDAAVFRTTWDYFERYAEFRAWFERAEAQTRLINAPKTLRWNFDKHYLLDLQRAGVRIVPSAFLEIGTRVELAAVLREQGWTEAVVKPAVSGAARHTYRIDEASAAAHDPIVNELLVDEAMIVQPFQRAIVEGGEITVMVFGGRASHAVRKVAREGDFRVQDDHGGSVHAHVPSDEEVDFAQRAMAAVDPTPVYGRVDFIRDNEGELAVMELELVEPELWFRLDPPSAERFAEALAAALSS